jgi:hypothetical protein
MKLVAYLACIDKLPRALPAQLQLLSGRQVLRLAKKLRNTRYGVKADTVRFWFISTPASG